MYMTKEDCDQKGKLNRVLVVADASNFEYLVAHSAFSSWIKKYPQDTKKIESKIELIDQDNLPDLLLFDSFRRELHLTTQNKLSYLDYLIKGHHNYDIYLADGVDFIFTEDDRLTGNFRKLKYPEYKANRKVAKKRFDIYKVKDYIRNVIFPDIDVEKHGYTFIKVKDCESDDIISVIMNRFDNYKLRILLSSDRDFLQLDGIIQYDMLGHKLQRNINGKREYTMTAKEFLLWKIVCGDKSDNIGHVFNGVGDIKSFKLIKDKEKLKQMLKEDQEAAKRFMLNKYLIDFASIPKDIENNIYNIVNETLETKRKTREEIEEFTLESCMEI